MASRTYFVSLMCLVTSLSLVGASNVPDKLSGLLDNSPFGVSLASTAAGTGTTDPLEFRSVLEEKGTKYFSIYDTAAHRSVWVELNDPVNGFTVKGYDAGHDNVTVEYHNKTLTLPQKRAPAVAQAVMPLAPLPTTGGMPQPNAPGMAMPAPGDPQRLLQIQEEIRRRRALRQQPMVQSPASGAQIVPQPFPSGNAGPQSGPQMMPMPTGSQSGPQMIPAGSPSVPSSPQPLPGQP